MKKLFLLLWFLPSIICLGQTKEDLLYLIDKFPVDKRGNVDFCITDSVSKASQPFLYQRAVQAINYYFKDSPSPSIPLYDVKGNVIIYRGRFGRYDRTKKVFSSTLHTYIYRFTLKIEYKENWYKIEIYDIEESENEMTIPLTDMLDKNYYNKTRQTANSIKSRYNSIYFIYNYMNDKLHSINNFLKSGEKKARK